MNQTGYNFYDIKIVKFSAGHLGLIGSAMKKFLENNKFKNILTQTRYQLDLMDNQKTFNFIKNKPDLVVIAAGKTGGIEENKKSPYNLI